MGDSPKAPELLEAERALLQVQKEKEGILYVLRLIIRVSPPDLQQSLLEVLQDICASHHCPPGAHDALKTVNAALSPRASLQ